MQIKLAACIRGRVRQIAADIQHCSVISMHYWTCLICRWSRSYIRRLHR